VRWCELCCESSAGGGRGNPARRLTADGRCALDVQAWGGALPGRWRRRRRRPQHAAAGSRPVGGDGVWLRGCGCAAAAARDALLPRRVPSQLRYRAVTPAAAAAGGGRLIISSRACPADQAQTAAVGPVLPPPNSIGPSLTPLSVCDDTRAMLVALCVRVRVRVWCR
jgi:hypothetical protein